MGVLLADPAVGRPACVSDAGAVVAVARGRPSAVGLDRLAKRAEIADRAHGIDPVPVQHRDAGAVVPAVFEFLKTGEQEGLNLPGAYVADDPAHLP